MCQVERDLADLQSKYNRLLTSYDHLQISRDRLRAESTELRAERDRWEKQYARLAAMWEMQDNEGE